MRSFLRNLASDRAKRRENRIRELQRDRDVREEELFQRIPRLREIKVTLTEIGLDLARLTLKRPTRFGKDANALAAWAKQLNAERAAMLQQSGVPLSYLAVHWDCNDCQNTGWLPAEHVDDNQVIPQRKCHCLLQEELEDLYRASGLTQPMRGHTFDGFDPSVYPAHLQAYMEDLRDECQLFADQVGAGQPAENLLLVGDVGLGKTFLATCIANRVLAANRTVVYLTFVDFLDLTKRARFASDDDETDQLERLLETDLLILDDLGAEKVSDYVGQELYRILNTRINKGAPLVITTNLDPETLEQTYSARIYSRLYGNFRRFLLRGEDVRMVLRERRIRRA